MKKTAITLFFLLQAACLFSQIPRPEYPRPQFERTDWINLNGEWTYTFDFGASGLERGYAGSKGFDGKIIVAVRPGEQALGRRPHRTSSAASGTSVRSTFRQTGRDAT